MYKVGIRSFYYLTLSDEQVLSKFVSKFVSKFSLKGEVLIRCFNYKKKGEIRCIYQVHPVKDCIIDLFFSTVRQFLNF